MKKILITTLIMMGAMIFAQETKTVILNQENRLPEPVVQKIEVEEPKAEVVTLPVEAIRSLSAEQIKEILERDKRRAEWIQERVKAAQEQAEKEKEVKEIKADEPKVEEVKPSSPVISKIITINEFQNHQTITCNVNDQVVIRLNASNGSRWERGKDENGVMDLLMEYHNEKGVKPRIVTLEFDFDEDEPELVEVVEEREDKSRSVRPFMPVMGMGMGGFGMGMNSTIRRTPRQARPENEIYVFEFQAMEEGTEKLTFKSVNTRVRPNPSFGMTFAQAPGFPSDFEGPFPTQPGMMGIGQNMIGPGRDPFGQPLVIPSPIPSFDRNFEITIKVKGE